MNNVQFEIILRKRGEKRGMSRLLSINEGLLDDFGMTGRSRKENLKSVFGGMIEAFKYDVLSDIEKVDEMIKGR